MAGIEDLVKRMVQEGASDDQIKVAVKLAQEKLASRAPPEISTWQEPSAGQQISARGAEGLFNVLGLGSKLADPFGPGPEQLAERTLGWNPYEVPRGFGYKSTVAEGVRGAVEDLAMGPFTWTGGGAFRTNPISSAARVLGGTLPSFAGGAASEQVRQRGGGTGAQVGAEVGTTLGLSAIAPGTRGVIRYLRGRGHLMPDATETAVKAYARAKEEGMAEVSGAGRLLGVSPEAPTTAAARISQEIPDLDTIPTFQLYPQLREYVPFLQRNPKLWNEILSDQGTRTAAILRRIKGLSDETFGTATGQDRAAAETLKGIIGENFEQKVKVFERAVEDAQTSTLRLQDAIGRAMPEEASGKLRNQLIEMEHESRLAAGDYYVENIPRNLRRSDVIDMTPLLEARDRVLPTTVSGRRKVPRGAVGDIAQIESNAEKLASEVAESAAALKRQGFDRLPKDQQEMLSELIAGRLDAKPLTNMDELLDLRSYILEMKRGLELRYPEKTALVGKLEELRKGIDEGIFDRMLADADNQSDLVLSMREANKQWKAYNDQFHRGVGAELFKRTRTGALRVNASATIGKMLQTPEGAEGLQRLFAGKEDLLNEYVSQWVGGTMNRGLMLEGTPRSVGKLQSFLAKHEAAFSRFPELKGQLDELMRLQKEIAEKGPEAVRLRDEFNRQAVYLFHGQEPTDTFQAITSITDKQKRLPALKEAIAYGGGDDFAREAFAKAYYRDLWGIPLDAPVNNVAEYIQRLKDIDVKAVRNKLKDRKEDLLVVWGGNYADTVRSIENILDGIEMAQKGGVGISKGYDLAKTGDYMQQFSNQILQRVWGTQIRGVSPAYTVLDRAAAFMTKGARERGIDRLVEAFGMMLMHPEVAESMLKGTEKGRLTRLNAFLRGNVVSQFANEKIEQGQP